ncbi:MAG TPA: 2'-5' RNA ligase family protein [Bacillota bacterium]|jgi:2'-5' RNA ligase|nr:2'-5' RNA ligase family protein [Bacillota bacterium]HOL08903.1 2'-5' RNA ligase family protein [Bacillota bacterium]HPO96596.1 2'-5' RNA ligase family protein [Bacillota bacterium]
MKQQGINLSNVAIVLELPPTVAEKVLDLRAIYDPDLALNIPVEITVAGSSGLGTIEPDQDSELVFAELEQIAQETAPFEIYLDKVFRFPNSLVYSFAIGAAQPIIDLHRRLAASKIRFKASPYPFVPHCSLHIWGELDPELESELLKIQITDRFMLDSFALYQLVEAKAVALVKRYQFPSVD